jgi:CcmD family protein
MLLVALLIWAGLFFFTVSLDRKVARLERHVESLGTASEDRQ